jgi:hypothetical protein
MLVKVRPLDGVPLAQQLPVLSFDRGAMHQARIPGEWYQKTATVRQIDDQPVIRNRHVHRDGGCLKH